MPASLPSPSFQAYGQTDRGLVRQRNEDDFLCDPERLIFAVADGLGGLPHGDLASRTAIEELKKETCRATPDTPLPWENIFRKISRRVFRCAESKGINATIGTTLTAVQILKGRKLRIGHVGDSGLFVFNSKRAMHLTTDHTLAQQEVLIHGQEILTELPEFYSHTLTRCVGQEEKLQVEIRDVPARRDDRLLLYSDGVTKTWELPELHQAVNQATSARELVENIITRSNERGGPDNVTAIAIFF